MRISIRLLKLTSLQLGERRVLTQRLMSGFSLRLESCSPRLNPREREDIRLGGFHLMLKVQFKVMESIVQIIATDVEIFNLMQKEEKEYTAKNIDTSAL